LTRLGHYCMEAELAKQPWVYVAALGHDERLILGDYLMIINGIVDPRYMRGGTTHGNWGHFRETLRLRLQERLHVDNGETLHKTINRITEEPLRNILHQMRQEGNRFVHEMPDRPFVLPVCGVPGCLDRSIPHDCYVDDCNRLICGAHSIERSGERYCSQHGEDFETCILCDRDLALPLFSQRYKCARGNGPWCDACGSEGMIDGYIYERTVARCYCDNLLLVEDEYQCQRCDENYTCNECEEW
jgi:hypothetical protein